MSRGREIKNLIILKLVAVSALIRPASGTSARENWLALANQFLSVQV
jgi:hypothetical protein